MPYKRNDERLLRAKKELYSALLYNDELEPGEEGLLEDLAKDHQIIAFLEKLHSPIKI
jgi:hypothetical protein